MKSQGRLGGVRMKQKLFGLLILLTLVFSQPSYAANLAQDHEEKRFRFDQTLKVSEVSQKEKKRQYYKQYLAQHRYKTPQHRIFYKNGY